MVEAPALNTALPETDPPEVVPLVVTVVMKAARAGVALKANSIPIARNLVFIVSPS